MLTLSLGFAAAGPARAAEQAPPDRGSAALSAAVSVLVDDVPVDFDVQPRIEGGRVLVPFRPIAEALGATVEWRSESQTVLAGDGRRRVRLRIGESTLYRDDAALPLDVPARVADGRTLIPLRAFGEAFGARVEWDGAARAARLFTPPSPMEVIGYYALGDRQTSSWTELFGRPFPERGGDGAARIVSDAALGWFVLGGDGDLLTLDARSGFRRPEGWEEMLKALRDAGVRGEMMVFASDHDGALARWLADPARARRAAQAIAAAAAPYDGVHLDLEGLGLTERGTELERLRGALTSFVGMVREELAAPVAGRPAERRPTLTLAVHPPNGEYRGYDLAALARLADRVVLMAYGYGPNGRPEPLARVQEAVGAALGEVPRERLLLGISAASEDAQSIRAKIGIARRAGLRGIALWRLGIIGPQRLETIRAMIAPRS